MSTMKDRPNRDALDRAVGIFRDAMRPFIVQNMSLVPGGRVKKTIQSSLDDESQERFRRRLHEGEGVEGAIDISDIPHIVRRRWHEVFDIAFGGDSTVQNTLWRIVKARNMAAHVGQRDIDPKSVMHHLDDIADILGRIDALDEKREVKEIRDALFRPAEDSTENSEAPNSPTPIHSPDQSLYWLNSSTSPTVLHKSTCAYVKDWAKRFPKNWKEYSSEMAARRLTSSQIHECRICF